MEDNIRNTDIIMYNMADVKNIFNCGRRQAYEIANSNGFPKIKIGNKFYVEKRALESWIAKNKGKEILLNK